MRPVAASNKTDKRPAGGAPPGPDSHATRLVTGMVAVAIGAALIVCVFLLLAGTEEEPLVIPQQPVSAGTADGRNPDAFGRPPGDPHYGHNHP